MLILRAIQKKQKKETKVSLRLTNFVLQMYHQLTSEQRSQIYALLQTKTSKKEIAQIIGCSLSTLYRELKRNSSKSGKYSKKAQEWTDIRRGRTCKNSKVKPWILNRALRLLKEEQWSPRQISGWLALNENIHISHERIYQAIREDITGELKKHCRHKMKYRRHGPKKKSKAGKSLIPNRVSIHDRPAEANGHRFGDWEMDLVVGRGQKSAVLTIIERSTNMFFQKKLDSKQPREVAMAVFLLLIPFKKYVHTITTDNGVEFYDHQWIARMLNTKIYFADPYCSGQKGAVENANKLFRQYFPKGTDFRLITQEELDQVQHKINRRPREKLGFISPKVAFFNAID